MEHDDVTINDIIDDAIEQFEDDEDEGVYVMDCLWLFNPYGGDRYTGA